MMNDNFDVIHAVGIRSFQALIAAMVSKKKNVPLIISDQGGLTTHPDIKQSSFKKRFLIKMQNPLIKYVINQATKIIVPNEYERKIFLEFSDESKISIVKNGIDIDEIKNFNPGFSKKFSINDEFILFLGRFHQVKGIDTLLKAINLIKNNPNFENLYKHSDKKEINIKLESGVLVSILSCNGEQCLIKTQDEEGWIDQDLIFGVYIDEVIVLRE